MKKEKLSKKQLRKEFNIWLGYGFDRNNKATMNQTNRWVLCYNGEKPGTFAGDCFDCACCLSNNEEKGCGCICHERIRQIVDFFYKVLAK
ncbi:MAG: hypothetical protein ACREBR_04985 [bacterium]